jgi:hypothetical protein
MAFSSFFVFRLSYERRKRKKSLCVIYRSCLTRHCCRHLLESTPVTSRHCVERDKGGVGLTYILELLQVCKTSIHRFIVDGSKRIGIWFDDLELIFGAIDQDRFQFERAFFQRGTALSVSSPYARYSLVYKAVWPVSDPTS